MIATGQAIKDYVWRGDTFIAMHSIDRYDIVEYWHKPGDNIPDQTRERQFGIYIDGKRIGHSFTSMDEALAGCIAIRHEGPNGSADRYFIRSMGIDTTPEKETGSCLVIGTDD